MRNWFSRQIWLPIHEFFCKFPETLRMALAISGSILIIRPGDVLILKTTAHLRSNEKNRIRDYWRALGGDIPVAIVDGSWQVLVVHPLTASSPSERKVSA